MVTKLDNVSWEIVNLISVSDIIIFFFRESATLLYVQFYFFSFFFILFFFTFCTIQVLYFFCRMSSFHSILLFHLYMCLYPWSRSFFSLSHSSASIYFALSCRKLQRTMQLFILWTEILSISRKHLTLFFAEKHF